MKLESLSIKIINKIKEFYDIDINNLLTDDAIIFGGIIRDIICNEDISKSKDIDIIVSLESCNEIVEKLKQCGWKINEKLSKINENSEQSNNRYHSNYFSLFVVTKVLKRIDLIIPNKEKLEVLSANTNKIFDIITNLMFLTSADLSSSNIGFNKHYGIFSPSNNSITLIAKKVFKINNNSFLYNDKKSKDRADELIKKGWILMD